MLGPRPGQSSPEGETDENRSPLCPAGFGELSALVAWLCGPFGLRGPREAQDCRVLTPDDIPGSSTVAPRVGTVSNCGGQTCCHREQDLQPDFGVTWRPILLGRRLLSGCGRGWGVEVSGLGVAQIQDGSGSPGVRPEWGVRWGPRTPKTDCSIGSHQGASGPETQEY